jgi:hypothetical protein
MRESILSIATKNLIVEGCAESKEEPKHGMFNAGGIGFGHGAKGMERAVTALTRTVFATGFNAILPVQTKDDGTLPYMPRLSN